jgi:hypothetical protein
MKGVTVLTVEIYAIQMVHQIRYLFPNAIFLVCLSHLKMLLFFKKKNRRGEGEKGNLKILLFFFENGT